MQRRDCHKNANKYKNRFGDTNYSYRARCNPAAAVHGVHVTRDELLRGIKIQVGSVGGCGESYVCIFVVPSFKQVVFFSLHF